MNIKSDFFNSLTSPPKHSMAFQPEEFLGHIYASEADTCSPLLHLLSCGTIEASFPFSFDIRSLDCYMLLHTIEGCGKLLINNQVYTLHSSTLLLLDCHERFRLDIAIEPWNYNVFFITGDILPYYYEQLPEKRPIITPLTDYCETQLCLNRLLNFSGINNSFSKLSVSGLLNTVLINCITSQLAEHSTATQIPHYLTELKELFDTAFQETYTLDKLADRFHISKYRLCREFGDAFGMPPVQYLNYRRIHMAKQLLLTTSLKVHEIGNQVGIENTNHFISLFRKINGYTPSEYKKRMTN